MKYDRSRHKLRKERYKQRIIKNIVFSCLSSVGIDHIGHLLEGKETDSQRQNNMPELEVCGKGFIQIIHKEIIIFVVKNKTQIKGQSHSQKDFFQQMYPGLGHLPFSLKELRQNIIDKNTASHDPQIAWIKVSIKPERHQHQFQLGQHMEACFVQAKIAQQSNRQKK